MPLRTRLTLWYSGILLLALLAFSLIVDFSVRADLSKGVDSNLQSRRQAVATYMKREIPRHRREQMNKEFQELVELSPGGQMIQILDPNRNWLYHSGSIRGFAIPAAAPGFPDGLSTRIFKHIPVRILTARILVNNEMYTVQFATPLDSVHFAIDRFRILLVALIPLMILVAAAGGYLLSRGALVPVDLIIAEARKIGLRNLSQRLPVPKTGDELQRLSETLNDMIQRLESSLGRVTQFTADVSHELRAPIALIRGTAELALIHPRDIATYKNALADILLESERTTKLVEDLLTISRADSAAGQLTLAAMDITLPLLEACAQGAAMAERKQLQFTCNIAVRVPEILADREALRRLFLILLDNAVKYTAAGGHIQVDLENRRDSVCVSIRDNGIGISAADAEYIFERFCRADKARQRDLGGAGLGLSIARWIAQSHEATIRVETQLGIGSAFHVEFRNTDSQKHFSDDFQATVTPVTFAIGTLHLKERTR